MEKNNELNKLFTKWQLRYSEEESFCDDGIINEEKYLNSNPKILFIAKEPNNPNQHTWDFREWWNKEFYYPFTYRIAEWAHGILNHFPKFDNLWADDKDGKRLHSTLKEVAFMNVKKSGGGGNSNNAVMKAYAKRDFEFIHQEIVIIEPQIIITGLSWGSLRKVVFPNIKWQSSGYEIDIGKYKQAKVIDFYHPSSRNAPAASYSLLQNVIESQEFQRH